MSDSEEEDQTEERIRTNIQRNKRLMYFGFLFIYLIFLVATTLPISILTKDSKIWRSYSSEYGDDTKINEICIKCDDFNSNCDGIYSSFIIGDYEDAGPDDVGQRLEWGITHYSVGLVLIILYIILSMYYKSLILTSCRYADVIGFVIIFAMYDLTLFFGIFKLTRFVGKDMELIQTYCDTESDLYSVLNNKNAYNTSIYMTIITMILPIFIGIAHIHYIHSFFRCKCKKKKKKKKKRKVQELQKK
eukprot:110032_1